MDNVVMFLCKYGLYTIVLKVFPSMKFSDFLGMITSKLPQLREKSLFLMYTFAGRPNCIFYWEEDLENLFISIKCLSIDCVDVFVSDANRAEEDYSEHEDMVCNDDPLLVRWGLDYQKDADMLADFCPHRKKSLLSDSWSNAIVRVNQEFKGWAEDFRVALSKYAIRLGFEFEYVKNERERVTTECLHRKFKGCRWRIHASTQHSNNYFYIRKFENEHTCVVSVVPARNTWVNSDLICSEICHQVRERPLTRPIDVKKDFKEKYGLEISYYTAWFGVDKARNIALGDHAGSYDELRWYIDVASKSNPGSLFRIDYDEETKVFKRFFGSFYACIHGFLFCRPILFLDGTRLKGRYKGTLLAATGLDANQGLFPVAFGIVDSENIDNWTWFLQHLSTILPNRVLTFISDRHYGILEGVRVAFPSCYQAYCLQHLKANLRDKLKGSSKFKNKIICKFGKCAYAPTKEIFHQLLYDLVQEGCNIVADFLKDLHFEHWSNAYFKGNRYGEMCSNPVESFNSWISEARHLPITKLVDQIRTQVMKLMAERRFDSRKWNAVLCPAIEKMIKSYIELGLSWEVFPSHDDVYEVCCDPSVTVYIGSLSCSCNKWQINSFPCAHVVAAIRRSGRDFSDFIDPYFYVQSFKESYAKDIHPIHTLGKPKPNSPSKRLILPPICKRLPRRPKKKRIPSRGENKKQIQCSSCKKFGNHNRKSCKNAI